MRWRRRRRTATRCCRTRSPRTASGRTSMRSFLTTLSGTSRRCPASRCCRSSWRSIRIYP
jgi:hypothetical protein